MLLAHRIELAPTVEHIDYFRRACGTARFTWNWGLAEWNRQYAAGMKPSAQALKKQFNAIKYAEFPWLKEIHRDAHAQPFAHLGKAWARFFSDLKAKKEVHAPVFKRKGQCPDSFYVANDKLTMEAHRVRLPVIGWVDLKEQLRFGGRILGASVQRDAHRWFLSVQIDVAVSWLPEADRRLAVGVDLNVAGIVCSNGKTYTTPQPLKAATRRLAIRQRRVSRKLEAAKDAAGIAPTGRIPKGTRLPVSKNREKASRRLAALHYRVGCLRHDFLHKTTSEIVRENQAVVIEDLSVKGMTANSKGTAEAPGKRVRQKSGLNRSILDVGFGEFRRQISYKAEWYGTTLIVADRWFPSSKTCSCCGKINAALTMKDRSWVCPHCGTRHDRDFNASVNLERLAPATALPEALGKVTSVRHDHRQQEESGQKPTRREAGKKGARVSI